jgi:TPR repeat protein
MNGGEREALFWEGARAFNEGNREEAFSMWLRAAVAGEPRAQCNMGKMYFNDVRTRSNLEQAEYWYLRSAKQGICEAQNGAGLVYVIYSENYLDNSMEYLTSALMWFMISYRFGYDGASKNVELVKMRLDIDRIRHATDLSSQFRLIKE